MEVSRATANKNGTEFVSRNFHCLLRFLHRKAEKCVIARRRKAKRSLLAFSKPELKFAIENYSIVVACIVCACAEIASCQITYERNEMKKKSLLTTIKAIVISPDRTFINISYDFFFISHSPAGSAFLSVLFSFCSRVEKAASVRHAIVVVHLFACLMTLFLSAAV